VVPFVDLRPANGPIRDRVLARFAETIERGDFTNGAAVGEFEDAFARFTGVRHAVGVGSGLDALRVCLAASGLEAGAEVIVPAMTFAATFEAVVQAGGAPRVVDVSEGDYALDLDAAADAAPDARYVMPVHLYGQMADMRRLADIAAEHELTIVEDACQAHGAQRDGIRPGETSLAATYSFYPAKNLGAFGDAGAVVTRHADFADRLRALRQHGETEKYRHDYVGWTARLDTVQAIVLLEKLPYLDEWNAQRRHAARLYTEALADVDGLTLPPLAAGSDHVWHLYVVRTSDREPLAKFLSERGIQTARHYPEPPHLAPAYRSLGLAPGDFPVAEALAREGLSLPIYAGIGEEQVTEVCDAVRSYFAVV
jgi:dTDP-4-amino-4,6-dideoxygalactose transaminase